MEFYFEKRCFVSVGRMIISSSIRREKFKAINNKAQSDLSDISRRSFICKSLDKLMQIFPRAPMPL